MQNTQAKDDAMAALDGDFAAIFNFEDEDAEMYVTGLGCVGCAE